MRDAIHAHKFRHSSGFHRGGNPKPGGCEGVTAERDYRTATEAANARFVTALGLAGREIEPVVPFDGLTAFERALGRVKAGASISDVIPFKRRADPPMTLGGVGSNWMAS